MKKFLLYLLLGCCIAALGAAGGYFYFEYSSKDISKVPLCVRPEVDVNVECWSDIPTVGGEPVVVSAKVKKGALHCCPKEADDYFTVPEGVRGIYSGHDGSTTRRRFEEDPVTGNYGGTR